MFQLSQRLPGYLQKPEDQIEERNKGNDGNAGNQGGNTVNHDGNDGNAGNQGGNVKSQGVMEMQGIRVGMQGVRVGMI